MTKRILIIDDEADLREIVQISIECFSPWQAEMAGSGAEGIHKATTESFDAILLDVSMPEIDGFQVVESLRSHPSTEQIPIILLTAKVQPNDRRRFGEIAVAGMITKPFASETIVSEMAQILGWQI